MWLKIDRNIVSLSEIKLKVLLSIRPKRTNIKLSYISLNYKFWMNFILSVLLYIYIYKVALVLDHLNYSSPKFQYN